MTIEYLKKAAKTPRDRDRTRRASVAAEMLADIEARGEAAVREYAAKLDGWTGEIVVTPDEIERRTRDIPAVDQARHRVRDRRRCAASRSRSANRSASSRPRCSRGSSPGQRLVPVNVAGCYVPTGPLRAHRVGLHEHRDREGRRRADGRRLLDAVPAARASIRRCSTR